MNSTFPWQFLFSFYYVSDNLTLICAFLNVTTINLQGTGSGETLGTRFLGWIEIGVSSINGHLIQFVRLNARSLTKTSLTDCC